MNQVRDEAAETGGTGLLCFERFERDQEPHDYVGDDDPSAEDYQQHSDHPHQGRIDVEYLAMPPHIPQIILSSLAR